MSYSTGLDEVQRRITDGNTSCSHCSSNHPEQKNKSEVVFYMYKDAFLALVTASTVSTEDGSKPPFIVKEGSYSISLPYHGEVPIKFIDDVEGGLR